jgi:hypothetical protein
MVKRLSAHLARFAALHLKRTFGDVLQRGLVRKQIEALEHHAGLQPLPPDLALGETIEPSALLAHA